MYYFKGYFMGEKEIGPATKSRFYMSRSTSGVKRKFQKKYVVSSAPVTLFDHIGQGSPKMLEDKKGS